MTTILRDTDGIAHIRADDLLGALRGQGHAAASDRLWQIEFDRRKALGTLAAIVGPNGLTADRYHRRLGIARAAQADAAALRPEAQGALRAYADGVNEFLAEGNELPPEFGLLGAPPPEPWEWWHGIAVFKVRHLWMGTSEVKLWRTGLVGVLGAEEAAALWPSVPDGTIDPTGPLVAEVRAVAAAFTTIAELVPDLAHLGSPAASNNLVISGARTATGAPLLAGDPHRAIDLPNVYWQNHITWTADGGGDAIGLSFPGVPGYPHFGHNRDVAWCITHGMADDHDLFIESLRRDGNAVQVHTADGWRDADVWTETIDVAGGESETIECVATANGGVIAGDPDIGVGLALRWTATAAPDTTYDALVPMLHATSVDELDAAFEPWVVPVNNVLMADRSGSIAYRMRGRLAVRGETNRWGVVDGADPAAAWRGFVDDADLPRVRDPDQGFLVTANNRVSTTGPYVSHDWAHPARALRLRALLSDTEGWTVDRVGALLGDTHSAVAAAFAHRIAGLDVRLPIERRVQSMLATWDHGMDADSAAAAVYAATRVELVCLLGASIDAAAAVTVDGVGYTLSQTIRALHVRVAFLIEDVSMIPDAMVRSAFRWAIHRLSGVLGPDPAMWRWGSVHRAGFHHPLAVLRPDLAASLSTPEPVELSGDNECVWASGTVPPSLASVTSPVARYVFDLADWDNSRWIVPHGVHGDPASAHHTDQLVRWSRVELAPMRFSAEQVDASVRSSITLPD